MESQVRRAVQYGIKVHQLTACDPSAAYSTAVREKPDAFLGAVIKYMRKMTALLCEEAPGAFNQHGIEFLLADQEEPGAATAADLSHIPYVTICSSIPLNEDLWVPPSFAGWDPGRDFRTLSKNYFVYRIRNLTVACVNRIANYYRRRAGLRLYGRPDDSFSKLAQITQLVREFDFPRKTPPGNLTYVGPFQRGSLRSVSFPYDRLDGRPLVYASLGTVQGVRTDLLLRIAQACANLPVQLVISLGGVEITDAHRGFPGEPVIVRYAPQREMLARSVAVIAHAGLNTIMEALSLGVPLISIPTNAGDQAGASARIRHYGVGQVLDSRRLNAEQVRDATLSVLKDPRYRDAAQRMKDAITQTGGAVQAARIIESLTSDRKHSQGQLTRVDL